MDAGEATAQAFQDVIDLGRQVASVTLGELPCGAVAMSQCPRQHATTLALSVIHGLLDETVQFDTRMKRH